jgi:3-methylcrotonyl-CoA carboxylase alpha subunit
MFTKILIANRGEIACRVAATAKRLGIRTVAVHSEADAHARHVQACDEAVCIGPASPRESYLRADRILEVAKATGAQAVHPGYGFLSENEGFAQACVDAGIAFIGPPPSAIAAMGSKSAAKALMAQAGVPLVPGYHGDRQEPDFLLAQAEAIGFPVLIKASAGGGGKGMRIVRQADEFIAALASCQREAQASFGDQHVLVERYVTQPRHVEIQVFADAHGHVIHLGERDCSVQRRHQKVLEEAPAPGMTAELRAQMGAAAVAAARSVGYVGAGTVEFICEQAGGAGAGQNGGAGISAFYFMEMNTRLQVEHPVTEAITGLDLVEWQLRVAAGEPLPLTQDQVCFSGHAIEARICAEQPEAGFLPAIGTLRSLRTPEASAFRVAPVRIDSGVAAGDAISPHYDSMIAKLIVHGGDRAQALARMDAALAELQVTGLHHNVAFLRKLVRTDSFAQARLDTALIEREQAALFPPTDDPALWQAALSAASLRWWQDQAGGSNAPDPWSRRDGWTLHGTQRHVLRWQRAHAPAGATPEVHTVTLSQARDGQLTLQGAFGELTLGRLQPDAANPHLVHTDAGFHASVDRHTDGADTFDAFTAAGHLALRWLNPLQQADDGPAHAGQVSAPMPGKVVALLVNAGDAVKAGQPVVVTEAMKMEHTLTAPRDGRVAELLCRVGDQVPEGAELLRIESE